ncbi:MAG: Gfo/Idh/MocA family protein [Planctomycetota bacterium]|jgi:glucose-fructose oxidoreductase
MDRKWKIAGIDFSHMHMGDLLRNVCDHPNAEVVGICDEDPGKMQTAIEALGISADKVYTDYRACLEATEPDMVILCPETGEHANCVERVAPFGAHVFVEKPFAESVEGADRMITAVEQAGKQLVINWPLRWVPSHFTTHRLICDGVIGDVIEVHYYDGNRGPLYHGADKIEFEPTPEEKKKSWWYQKASGGGALRDYLGYGVTLGAWFDGGRLPIEVTAATSTAPGLEVDEHAIIIARYAEGLSKFETRWGTFTDPWVHQPQPKCGFVVRGTDGTISSYDYEPIVRVQTRERPEGYEHPVDELPEGERNAIEYVIGRLERGEPIEGPLAPSVSRIGQQIVDAAIRSAEQKKTVLFDEC